MRGLLAWVLGLALAASGCGGGGEGDVRTRLIEACASGCVQNPEATDEHCASRCECIIAESVAAVGEEEFVRLTHDEDALRPVMAAAAQTCSEQALRPPEADAPPAATQADQEDTETETGPAHGQATIAGALPSLFYRVRQSTCDTGYTLRDRFCVHVSAEQWTEDQLQAAFDAYGRGAAPPPIGPPANP